MLLTIESARSALAKMWWASGVFNAMALAVFLFPLFRGIASTQEILSMMAVGAGIGLVAGIHLTFRSTFDSTYALWTILYGIIVMEFLFSGGGSALALAIAGRAHLGWMAVYTNSFVLLFTLLGGMVREAKALDLWGGNKPNLWKEELAKYLDYSNHLVSPLLTTDSPLTARSKVITSPMWIVSVGSANIPLLFELYAGGRINAVFLAAPVLTGVLAYLNLKTLGPGLVRLLLLRKLEKSIGRKFINADLEQIQQLRRGFFLARWLMKNFTSTSTVSSGQIGKSH
jgi:hypothetical protein